MAHLNLLNPQQNLLRITQVYFDEVGTDEECLLGSFRIFSIPVHGFSSDHEVAC